MFNNENSEFFNTDPTFKPVVVTLKKITVEFDSKKQSFKLPDPISYIIKKTKPESFYGALFFTYIRLTDRLELADWHTCQTTLKQRIKQKLEKIIEEAYHWTYGHNIQLRALMWPLKEELEVSKLYSGICKHKSKFHICSDNPFLVLEKHTCQKTNITSYDIMIDSQIYENVIYCSLDNITLVTGEE